MDTTLVAMVRQGEEQGVERGGAEGKRAGRQGEGEVGIIHREPFCWWVVCWNIDILPQERFFSSDASSADFATVLDQVWCHLPDRTVL